MSLDLTQLIADFGRLAERYALRCKRAGVRFGHPGFPRWIARLYRREGLRGLAAAWYLRSSRVSGHRLDLLRALGVLLGERAMRSGAVFLGERPGARAKRHPPQPTRSVPFSWLSAHEAMLRPSGSSQPPGRRS